MSRGLLMWIVVVLILGAILGGLYWCTVMPGRSPALSTGFDSADTALIRELADHVQKLAGDIGERNYLRPERLEAAATYIEQSIQTLGINVTRETYTYNDQAFHNLVAEIPGSDPQLPIVLVGAHYDSVAGSPGANDNASGVAALLALVGRCLKRPRSRTIRFVAFVNEEPPFYRTPKMGSAVHATSARENQQTIHLMLALETIGFYTDRSGSQRYPFPLSFLYPDRGNFIAFVGNLKTRNQVRNSVHLFRSKALFPAEGIAAPAVFPGIDWSDHWSFWRAGYPALMVTDTALFRYRHYHAVTDVPEIINYPRMARVVEGLTDVIDEYANN